MTTPTDALSAALVGLVEQVKPSVVQVRSQRRGMGTGVIWRADGAIVTNNHVVARKQAAVQVMLQDGRTLDAKVMDSNSTLDLAVLQVAATGLPAAAIADSTKLRIGELVFAIGHPWGQPNVVTSGIVSGLGSLEVADWRNGRRTAQYIRSDVGLAPGNSGGPLLNAKGEVVGINAMIFGGDLSVAIPSHVATAWANSQPKRRARLGVTAQPVPLPEQWVPSAQGKTAGLLVAGLESGGAAAQARVWIGDVILEIEGKTVVDWDSLSEALSVPENTPFLTVQVLRNGDLATLRLPFVAAG